MAQRRGPMSEGTVVAGVIVVLIAGGLLFPFWPLAALGVAVAGSMGRFGFAIGGGLLVDLLWGAPPGILEAFMFPMTVLALLSILSRFLAKRYFFPKSSLRGLY